MGNLINVLKSFGFGWFRMEKDFIEFPKQIKVLSRSGDDSGRIIPKIIWMYWEETNLPKSIQSFVYNIQKLNPDHEIRMLNSENVRSFLPDFDVRAEMPIANKSDLIRLELLFIYGGIWLDASIIFKNSLDWVYSVNEKHSFDVIGYYREITTKDFKYPVMETWFLAAYPKNEFIGRWLDVLKPLGKLGSKGYFNLLKEREDYLEIKQLIEPPDYLLVYLACQIAQRELQNTTYYLKKVEDCAYFIHEKFDWNRSKINYMINRIPYKNESFELIKLTGIDRALLNKFEQLHLIRKKSLIGQLFRKRLN